MFILYCPIFFLVYADSMVVNVLAVAAAVNFVIKLVKRVLLTTIVEIPRYTKLLCYNTIMSMAGNGHSQVKHSHSC